MDIKDLEKELLGMWEKKMPKQRAIVAHTGRGGAINFHAQGEIYMKEKFGGETLTEEEKKAIHEQIENSQIWEDGIYQIDENGCKYLGLEDMDAPEGTIVIKDGRGVWRIEEWKNHWRTNYRVLTEEEAHKMIEEHGGKLKENG